MDVNNVNCKTKKGFTLLEMMIFVTLMSIVLLTMVGYTIHVMKVMKANEHRLWANIYAENIKEWLDGERESSVGNVRFYASDEIPTYTNTTAQHASLLNSATVRRYCLNNNFGDYNTMYSISFSNATSCSFGSLSPPIYRRELFLIRNNVATGPVYVIIRVSWYEGGILNSVVLDNVYTDWE